MNKFIEYDNVFTNISNWQIYFGFVKRYTIVYGRRQWLEFCIKKQYPEIYKKLTVFTLTKDTLISILEK